MVNPLACAVSPASLGLSALRGAVAGRAPGAAGEVGGRAGGTGARRHRHVRAAQWAGHGADGEGAGTAGGGGLWLCPSGRLLYTMSPFKCKELVNGHMRQISEAMYKVASKL